MFLQHVDSHAEDKVILLNRRQIPLRSTFSTGSLTPFFRSKPKFYNVLSDPMRLGHTHLSVSQSVAENTPQSALALSAHSAFGFSFAVLSASNAYPDLQCSWSLPFPLCLHSHTAQEASSTLGTELKVANLFLIFFNSISELIFYTFTCLFVCATMYPPTRCKLSKKGIRYRYCFIAVV